MDYSWWVWYIPFHIFMSSIVNEFFHWINSKQDSPESFMDMDRGDRWIYISMVIIYPMFLGILIYQRRDSLEFIVEAIDYDEKKAIEDIKDL